MQNKLAETISRELNIPLNSVSNTVRLLDDGATIPFISRYRKEATGNLDDEKVQSVEARLRYYREIEKRKGTILKTIEGQGKLTEELTAKILGCWDATELEDIYLPFKPKRKTRAEAARLLGLEPLAKIIMAQRSDNVEERAREWVNCETVADTDAAIAGALDIVAEWISENSAVRNSLRRMFRHEAVISSRFVKGKEIEGRNYENYYEFSRPLRTVLSHQLLAMRRGEKEGFLKVSIDVDDRRATDNVSRIVVKGHTEASQMVERAVEDSYKRLLKPQTPRPSTHSPTTHASCCLLRHWGLSECWPLTPVSAPVARWCASMSMATCFTTMSSTPPRPTTTPTARGANCCR